VEAIAHARHKYIRSNLAFVICDAQDLPFAQDSFETVVSFEVIEHIPNVRRYLAEIKRVAMAKGVSIISTPNRRLRLLPFQKPWNRFHLREYSARDLVRALSIVFTRVQVRGITANSEVFGIEKKRVRQNPFVAYPKMIAQLILPNPVYEQLRQIRSRFRHPAAARANAFDVTKFSVENYMVSDALYDCINLIGVCER
jgi:SAM-dependent methyltransferase